MNAFEGPIECSHYRTRCYRRVRGLETEIVDSYRQPKNEYSHCSACCYHTTERAVDESWRPVSLRMTATIILSGTVTEQQRVQSSGDNPVTRLRPPLAADGQSVEVSSKNDPAQVKM